MRPPPTLPITLAGFAAFLDLYATQPLLPLLAKTFHASTFEVGLTVTAPTVAVAIAAPIIGRVADRFGLRRVILGSACALTVTTVMAATSGSLHQLIAWRFVQGLATPGIFASAIAYVHEVWPPDRAGRGTAMYMSGTVVGGFTGRLVAGLTAAAFSWSMSFVALAAFNALIAAALFFWLPSEKRHVKVSSPATRGGLGHLLANRRLVATCGVGFTVLFTQVAMFTYVTFHLAAPPFELSTQALGWLFVVYLVGAVVTPISGRWIDIYGHRAGLGSAMALGAAGALLTLAPSLPAIVAGLASCATGVFVAQATATSYIGAVTTQDRGVAVGLYSTFYYAGGSTGAALPSLFWNAGGWTACVALVVVVQSVGVAIALTQWGPARGHHDLAV
jgi:MFS transporter, YNFM family, putative membrane transport protein